jgi:hypothetical protein
MLRVMAIQGAQFATSSTGMRHVLENLTNIDDGVSQTAPGGTLGIPTSAPRSFLLPRRSGNEVSE